MNRPPRNYILTVTIETPDGRRLHSGELEVDPCAVDRALGPLPRDREITPWEAQRAEQMQIMRREVIRWATAQFCRNLSEVMEPELKRLIESQDTINGYDRETWKAMHR